MQRKILFFVLVLPGVFGFVFCGYYALLDWAQLQRAYAFFVAESRVSHVTMERLFIAEAHQNIHRINVFADVVWALLCAVVAAIGIRGLCDGH